MDRLTAYTWTYKKAFDRVPHNKLIWKLENIDGLKGTTKERMKKLSAWRGNKNSDEVKIRMGKRCCITGVTAGNKIVLSVCEGHPGRHQ